jgi:hypothetical protein
MSLHEKYHRGVSPEKIRSRGRIKKPDPEQYFPSEVVTYDVPWMWSHWPFYPSELLKYPVEHLPLDQWESLGRKKDHESEPEMFATKLKGKYGPRERKVKGHLL